LKKRNLHVFYFTELLALALGADLEECGLQQHETDVGKLLTDSVPTEQLAVV